jgi:carboxypeptidase family protein
MKLTYGRRRNLRDDERGVVQELASFLAVSVLILGLSTAGLAQELAATLTGTVTDSSGAVVAGATVLVHSNETGIDAPSVTTTDTGSFNITHLPAGRYTVTVKNAGFQTYVANDVILDVAEKHTLEVQLKTGKISETLEVTAENTPIQTTTAEESGTVTGDQLRGLALNNRNFEQLVLLQPGVANQLGDEPGFGLSSNTSISINGARTGANNWTVDGADINDSGSNGTLLNTPSIDAIQEFTLERSNYDASFGRSGGGQVVVATRAGTNQFHGSAYEFNRNNYFNANTFENRQTIASNGYISGIAGNGTPIERYNDWGFTIGGPIEIPKVYTPDKDKTYFFWSEEWRHASTPGSLEIPVPTTAQLQGIFTTPINVAPAGCVTTAGTGSNETYTINPTCYSQNAAAYLTTFMVPNPANVGNNLLDVGYTSLNNFRQDIIRLDQNVGDRVRLFGRYMQDSVPENFPFGLWGTANYPGTDAVSLNAPGRNLVANASVNISPKVVNEVEFADSWGAINATLSGVSNSPSFTGLLTGNTAYQDPYGRAPNASIVGYTGLSNGDAPYFERNIDKNLFDNLSIQHGNHTFRVGATAMWMTKTENASSGLAQFNFDGANGNDPFANFLLGQAASYSQADKDTIPDLHYVNFEAYVQDDWKVTPRLTVNLGVRYSYFPSPWDANNFLVNFDPSKFVPGVVTIAASGNMNPGPAANAATYANGMIFPTGATCSSAQAIYTMATCSPYGSRVNASSNNNWGPRFGLAWDPQGNGKMSVRAGYGLFYDRTLNGIWEQNEFGTYPFNADPPLVQTAATNNPAENANLFDNSSVGTPPGPSLAPINPVMTGTPSASGTLAFRAPSYQDYNVSVQREVMPNTVLEVGYVGTKGTHLVGDIDLNQPTVAARTANELVDVNAIRPFPGYGAIDDRSTVFTSNYNSLQASLNRRMSHGLTLGVSYTWSKLLTTNPQDRSYGATDTYDLKQGYGLSTLNTPQIFVLSYVYQEPFFKDQHGLGWVLGGWEISGIVNFQTGQSLTVTQSLDPFDPGTGGNPAAPGAGNRGLGFLQGDSTNRANQNGSTSGPKTPAEYFNTAAFSQSVGAFGTSAPGALLGPGFQRWDTSLFKNIKLGERASFQLRLETFNTFNHGSPSQLCNGVCEFGTSAFGTVTAYHIPRELQIGGKFNF